MGYYRNYDNLIDSQKETGVLVCSCARVTDQNVPCLVPAHSHSQREDRHVQCGLHEGSVERSTLGTGT